MSLLGSNFAPTGPSALQCGFAVAAPASAAASRHEELHVVPAAFISATEVTCLVPRAVRRQGLLVVYVRHDGRAWASQGLALTLYDSSALPAPTSVVPALLPLPTAEPNAERLLTLAVPSLPPVGDVAAVTCRFSPLSSAIGGGGAPPPMTTSPATRGGEALLSCAAPDWPEPAVRTWSGIV